MLTHASLADIGKALAKNKSNISRQAKRESWPYEERKEKGGPVRYFALDTLPKAVRVAVLDWYWRGRVDGTLTPGPSSIKGGDKHSELPPRNPADGVKTASGALAGGDGLPLGRRKTERLTPPGVFSDEMTELLNWTGALAIHLTPKQLADPDTVKKLKVARLMEECPPYQGRTELANMLALEYGVTRQTIYRWWDEVKTWRVQAHVPEIVVENVKIELPHSRAFDQEALAYGVAVYGRHLKQGQLWAYGQLEAEAVVHGWRIGDYTSFSRLLGKIPEPVWDAIRKGPTGFELQIVPKIIRSWLETPVYQTLCGDQNVFDYLVYDEMTGEIFVMNLYLWMDCTSRGWTGIWPSFGPYRGYTVGYSLREALRLGLPDEIYTDWGKCELSNYVADVRRGLNPYCLTDDFFGMNGRYAGFEDDGDPAPVRTGKKSGKDGVKHRLARVGTPWLKPIENQMNILKRGLLDQDLPGFRQKLDGPWENKVRQMDVRMALRGKMLMTAEQMLEAVKTVIERHNRETCKLAELHGGTIVPMDVLSSGLKGQSRTVIRDETLDYLFLPRKELTCHQGVVKWKADKLDHRVYYCAELTKFKRREERKVTVYFDPFDTEAPAKITTSAGEFIGLAEPWKSPKAGDGEALSEMNRKQKRLLKDWRDGIAALLAPARGYGVNKLGPADRAARQASKAEGEREAIQAASGRADEKIVNLFGANK